MRFRPRLEELECRLALTAWVPPATDPPDVAAAISGLTESDYNADTQTAYRAELQGYAEDILQVQQLAIDARMSVSDPYDNVPPPDFVLVTFPATQQAACDRLAAIQGRLDQIGAQLNDFADTVRDQQRQEAAGGPQAAAVLRLRYWNYNLNMDRQLKAFRLEIPNLKNESQAIKGAFPGAAPTQPPPHDPLP